MGTKGKFFEGIEVGSEIRPLIKNITAKELFMYAAATWDPYPGHYDPTFAQSQGFKDVYLDGPMNAAFMAQFITDWIGMHGTLSKLSLTYRTMVFPGDSLTCTGKVTKKYTKDDVNFIECEILLRNQDGKTVALGKATLLLCWTHPFYLCI